MTATFSTLSKISRRPAKTLHSVLKIARQLKAIFGNTGESSAIASDPGIGSAVFAAKLTARSLPAAVPRRSHSSTKRSPVDLTAGGEGRRPRPPISPSKELESGVGG